MSRRELQPGPAPSPIPTRIARSSVGEASSGEPIRLSAEQLQKRYGGRTVVDRIDLTVDPGEIVGLLGPNGAGKTTTFKMMVGLVRPDGGTVRLGDESLTGLPLHRRAAHGVTYLPQEPSIFRKLTVRENLLAVLELRGGLTRSERRARADALLEELGLARLARALGDTLSGGERRRVEIARCLATEPLFVLFDEPFAGVDPINVADLQQQIALLRERGLGVLITDHDVQDTLAICDRAYIMSEGRLLVEGSPEALAADVTARTVYLGEGFRLAGHDP